VTTRIRSIAITLILASLLRSQEGDDAQLAHLREQLLTARAAADQTAATSLLQRLCILQPEQPAFPYLLAETHASLGPEFDPKRTAELCQRFLALTDPSRTPADPLAELTALGITRPGGLHALRLQAQALYDQQSRERPERLLLWPDHRALSRKVSSLAAERARLTADETAAARKLKSAKARAAAAEADYTRARRSAAANQFVDLTELWTRVLDRREEVQVLSRRCERLTKDLQQNHTDLERHRARLHLIEASAKLPR
jgi:hypothetical protein